MKRLWVLLFVVPIFSQDKLSESSWDSLQIDEEYQYYKNNFKLKIYLGSIDFMVLVQEGKE